MKRSENYGGGGLVMDRASRPNLAPFVIRESLLRNQLSSIVESSTRPKTLPGLKEFWRGLREVVEK